MKQFGLLVLTILLGLSQGQAQTKNAKIDMAFDKTKDGLTAHDFGSIVYGANGKVDFTFTNQGTVPLAISNVTSSCGCTVPTWTKEPVAPGQKGTITVVYNTTLPGVFNKTIEVISNANNSPVRITVMGKVNSQPNDLNAVKMNSQSNKTIMPEGDKEQAVPQDSASKAQAAAVSKAQKAAQQEGFKKLMQQQPTGQKSGTKMGTPVTTTSENPVIRPAGTPVKKK